MSVLSEVQIRRAALSAKLHKGVSKYHSLGMINLWVNLVLMLIILISSSIAAIGGLLKKLDGETVGAIALVPGLATLFATTLKFQVKSFWHYRKSEALDRLANRLDFQLPANPSVEDVGAIANDLAELTEKMTKEWGDTCSFDFAYFKSRKNRL